MAETFVQVTEGSGKKLHTWDKTVGANSVHDEVTVSGMPYLPTYVVVADTVSVATAAAHLVAIQAGASLNVYILRMEFWQASSVTTAAIFYPQIVRLTTAGTGGTSITPAPLDTADAASGATARSIPSSKGTESTFLHRPAGTAQQGLSTTGPWTPVMTLDYQSNLAKPIKIPAGTANGLAIKNAVALAAGAYNIMVWFVEASF